MWQIHAHIQNDDAFGITFALDGQKIPTQEAALRYARVALQQLGIKESDYSLDIQLTPDNV